MLQAASTLRGQQCGPHRKKEPLRIRAVPTPSPCPHPCPPHQVTFQPHRLTVERLSLEWLLFRSNLLGHRRLTEIKLQPCDPPDLRGQKLRGDCKHPPCHLHVDFRRRLPLLFCSTLHLVKGTEEIRNLKERPLKGKI